MSILAKRKSASTVELSPDFLPVYQKFVGKKAALMKSKIAYKPKSEVPGILAAARELELISSGKIVPGRGIDHSKMRINRLPYEKLLIAKRDDQIVFRGITRPILMANVPRGDGPGKIALGNYQILRFYEGGKYFVDIPIQDLVNEVFEYIWMYPEEYSDDPRSHPHWHPHHYCYSSGRPSTCWGSFISGVKGYVVTGDPIGLFAVLFRYLQIITQHDILCQEAIYRLDEVSVEDFIERGLKWP